MAGSTSAEVLAKLHKDFGKEIGGLGFSYANLPRLPFDVFPLDLALGGGIPLAKLSIVFGPESSGKTNLALKAIAMAQLLFPHMKAVFVDAEQAFDAAWAKRMGVDINRLILIQPDFAEQAVDMCEAFLYAQDVSIVVLDSIPALITSNEIASSADKAIVGGSSNVIGKLIRKGVLACGQRRKTSKDGFGPVFLCINQIRHKIGVMFGDPETMPGGNAPRFAASCIIRCYGKNLVDNKVNASMPAYKDVSAIIRKWKFPILQVNASFKMQMLEFAGRTPGFVDDWNTVSTYLKELGYLGKAEGNKGGWLLGGAPYNTLGDIKELLYGNPKLMAEYKAAIIDEMVSSGQTIAESAGEEMATEDTP